MDGSGLTSPTAGNAVARQEARGTLHQDLPAPIRTRLQTASANAIARRFTEDAVEGRREDAKRFLAAMEHALQLGMDAGATGLDEIAIRVSDSMSDLIGGMAKDLDNAGVVEDGALIDLTDLNAIIAQLRGA